MSVMTFGIRELGNVAAAIMDSKSHSYRGADVLRDVCESLALISQANIACFNAKYRTNESPATEEGIMSRVTRSAGSYLHDLPEAIRTASGFFYNCVDDGGDFTLKIEGAHAALIDVLRDLMNAAIAKAEALR